MEKHLNSMPNYRAKMPKQPHDVSQSNAFTACPAMLLPVYFDMLHHGDTIHFHGNMFARLNPMVVASLGKVDVHVNYFFVPLSLMYTPAPSLFYQTQDILSSNIDVSKLVKDSFPKYDINSSLSNILTLNYTLSSSPYYYTESSTHPDASSIVLSNVNFDCVGKSYYRMLDMFRYNPTAVFTSAPSNVRSNPVTTPWFLAAYQACYQLYYRNDDREYKDYCYNFDRYYDQQTWETPDLAAPMFTLRYASRNKDYFNAVKVSPIGSSISMLNGSDSWSLLSSVNSYLTDSPSYRGTSENGFSQYSDDLYTQSVQTLTDVGGFTRISSAGIRQLFMVDKMLRVIGRADKNYESQFLAHYGVKIPHDVMHNITHIGHDTAVLSPEPIISSANTFDSSTGDGSALGEIGGQGQVSLKGSKRSFTAPFHGVFMAIVHFMPRMRYVPGIDKLHDLSSPMSFWQPEYDRRGMQPLFLYETDSAYFNQSSTRLGWQFAYEQFKRKYDVVSRAFLGAAANQTDTVNTYSPWVMSIKPFGGLTSAGFNMPSITALGGSFYSLLGSPNDLNGIMQVPHSTLWSDSYTYDKPWLLYQTDPLICDFYLECKKVNFMSEFGEPQL